MQQFDEGDGIPLLVCWSVAGPEHFQGRSNSRRTRRDRALGGRRSGNNVYGNHADGVREEPRVSRIFQDVHHHHRVRGTPAPSISGTLRLLTSLCLDCSFAFGWGQRKVRYSIPRLATARVFEA